MSWAVTIINGTRVISIRKYKLLGHILLVTKNLSGYFRARKEKFCAAEVMFGLIGA